MNDRDFAYTESDWWKPIHQNAWVKEFRYKRKRAYAVISGREERINRPKCSRDLTPDRWRRGQDLVISKIKIALRELCDER